MTDADWARMIGVNLTGVFHTCRAAVPRCEAWRWKHRQYRVIGRPAWRGGALHYAASKGGMMR